MFRSLLAVTPVLALLTGTTVAQTSQNLGEPTATTSSKPMVVMENVGSAASAALGTQSRCPRGRGACIGRYVSSTGAEPATLTLGRRHTAPRRRPPVRENPCSHATLEARNPRAPSGRRAAPWAKTAPRCATGSSNRPDNPIGRCSGNRPAVTSTSDIRRNSLSVTLRRSMRVMPEFSWPPCSPQPSHYTWIAGR